MRAIRILGDTNGVNDTVKAEEPERSQRRGVPVARSPAPPSLWLTRRRLMIAHPNQSYRNASMTAKNTSTTMIPKSRLPMESRFSRALSCALI